MSFVQALPAGGGVMPYKRPASEKSGVPVYQPAGVQQQQQQQQLQQQQAAYHQIIQLQQQQQGASIVPVTCKSQCLQRHFLSKANCLQSFNKKY